MTHKQMCGQVGGPGGPHPQQPLTATQLGQLGSLWVTLGKVPATLSFGALFAECICRGRFLEKAEDCLEPQPETEVRGTQAS